MRQFCESNSVYPTSTRHRPSAGAGGAVARLHVASISFSNASSSAPAAASLIEVAKSTLTICQLWLATKLVATP
jgi:hypothetical protein